MTTTLSITFEGDTYTSTPLEVLGYQATFQGNNIFHQTLAGGLDVTLVPASLRSGTLEFLFATEFEALQCAYFHNGVTGPLAVQLSDDELATVGMYYVLNGRVTVTLEDETRSLWKVSVDYQEVPTS